MNKNRHSNVGVTLPTQKSAAAARKGTMLANLWTFRCVFLTIINGANSDFAGIYHSKSSELLSTEGEVGRKSENISVRLLSRRCVAAKRSVFKAVKISLVSTCRGTTGLPNILNPGFHAREQRIATGHGIFLLST